MPNIVTEEDTDFEEIRKKFASKTSQELDEEFERLKKEFKDKQK